MAVLHVARGPFMVGIAISMVTEIFYRFSVMTLNILQNRILIIDNQTMSPIKPIQ